MCAWLPYQALSQSLAVACAGVSIAILAFVWTPATSFNAMVLLHLIFALKVIDISVNGSFSFLFQKRSLQGFQGDSPIDSLQRDAATYAPDAFSKGETTQSLFL